MAAKTLPNKYFEKFYQYIFDADRDREDVNVGTLYRDPSSGWNFNSDTTSPLPPVESFDIAGTHYRLRADQIQRIRRAQVTKRLLPVVDKGIRKHLSDLADGKHFNEADKKKFLALYDNGLSEEYSLKCAKDCVSAITAVHFNSVSYTNEIQKRDEIIKTGAEKLFENVSGFSLDVFSVPAERKSLSAESLAELYPFSIDKYSEEDLDKLCDYFDEVEKRAAVLCAVENNASGKLNVLDEPASEAYYDFFATLACGVKADNDNFDIAEPDYYKALDAQHAAEEFAYSFVDFQRDFEKKFCLHGLNPRQMNEVYSFVRVNNVKETMADIVDLYLEEKKDELEQQGISVREFGDRFDYEKAAKNYLGCVWEAAAREIAETVVDDMAEELIKTITAERVSAKKKETENER